MGKRKRNTVGILQKKVRKLQYHFSRFESSIFKTNPASSTAKAKTRFPPSPMINITSCAKIRKNCFNVPTNVDALAVVANIVGGNVNVASCLSGTLISDFGCNSRGSSKEYIEGKLLLPFHSKFGVATKKPGKNVENHEEEFVLSLFEVLISKTIKSVFISSHDEDTWKYLPTLIKLHKQKELTVESIIFSGNPIQYVSLQDDLKGAISNGVIVYFTVLKTSVNQICQDRSMTVGSFFMEYDIADNQFHHVDDIMPAASYNGKQYELNDGTIVNLPFEEHLTVCDILKGFIPIVNPGVTVSPYLQLPLNYSIENGDVQIFCMIVGSVNFTFFGDARVQMQRNFNKWAIHRSFRTHTLVIAHDATNCSKYFDKNLLKAVDPLVVCATGHRGNMHPNYYFLKDLEELSLAKVESHNVEYLCYSDAIPDHTSTDPSKTTKRQTPTDDEIKIMARQFRTEKAVYTMHFPVEFLITADECSVLQNEPSMIG